VTLIAFHAHQDGAEVMTDTLAYDHVARHVSETTKVLALPSLDAVTMIQGSTIFGQGWFDHAQDLAADVDTLDEFLGRVRKALVALWADLSADVAWQRTRPLSRSAVFVIGPSERLGRYVATLFASADEFVPHRHDGLFVLPSPLTMRPSQFELDRLDGHLAQHLGLAAPAAADMLRRLPDAPEPAGWSAADWRRLALSCHRDRALVDLYSGLKTYVGGDVVLTHLAAGMIESEVLHRFPTDGPEWEAMLRYSLHPIGQLGPCSCPEGDAEGRPAIECCLPDLFERPCPCGSGETFAGCCKVAAYSIIECSA
jgi:hypothetical protein